jgi:hypothetical protein
MSGKYDWYRDSLIKEFNSNYQKHLDSLNTIPSTGIKDDGQIFFIFGDDDDGG